MLRRRKMQLCVDARSHLAMMVFHCLPVRLPSPNSRNRPHCANHMALHEKVIES